MFEQASIDTRGALTSPWALAVSVTGQTLAVGAVILFSLIHTEVIRPPSFLATTLTVPTGPPPPPAQLEQRTVARPSAGAGWQRRLWKRSSSGSISRLC